VKRLLLGAVAVLVLLLGLVGVQKITRAPRRVGEPARAPAPASTRAQPAATAPVTKAALRDRLPPRAVEPPAGAPRDRTRESAVYERLRERLLERPGVYTVSSVTCDTRSCRVVLETADLTAFAPVLALLEERDTGFVGEAEMMQLDTPVPLGEDGGGPWRVVFTLWRRELRE
jgi:hypothetical protein